MQTRKRFLFCLFLLLPLLSHAQYIYMCKDASGRTLGSDRPIRECADRAVRELDKSGVVRREIAAPLTPEQKLQKQQEEDKRKAAEAAEAAQKQDDRALLARYRNEADIASARKREVDLMREHIKRETAALTAIEHQNSLTQAEMARHKNKKEVVAVLQRKLIESDQAIKDQNKKIHDYGAEIISINARYDTVLKRYRELAAPAAAK
ncbi:MAG: DUF4124 domain-containing protein [Pseudomonadota bacterium]